MALPLIYCWPFLVGADGRGGRLGALLADQKFNGVRGPFVRRIASPGRGIATFLFHGSPEALAQVHEIVRQAILQLNADLLQPEGLKPEELQQGSIGLHCFPQSRR